MFAICGAVTWRFRGRAVAIFHDADSAARDLGLLAGVLGRLEAERFSSARLAALRAELDIEGEPPSRRIARLHALMGLVDSRDHLLIRLLGPLVLWDLHLDVRDRALAPDVATGGAALAGGGRGDGGAVVARRLSLRASG